MENYKGIYYNESKQQKFYEGGAHFRYKDLYRALRVLLVNNNMNNNNNDDDNSNNINNNCNDFNIDDIPSEDTYKKRNAYLDKSADANLRNLYGNKIRNKIENTYGSRKLYVKNPVRAVSEDPNSNTFELNNYLDKNNILNFFNQNKQSKTRNFINHLHNAQNTQVTGYMNAAYQNKTQNIRKNVSNKLNLKSNTMISNYKRAEQQQSNSLGKISITNVNKVNIQNLNVNIPAYKPIRGNSYIHNNNNNNIINYNNYTLNSKKAGNPLKMSNILNNNSTSNDKSYMNFTINDLLSKVNLTGYKLKLNNNKNRSNNLNTNYGGYINSYGDNSKNVTCLKKGSIINYKNLNICNAVKSKYQGTSQNNISQQTVIKSIKAPESRNRLKYSMNSVDKLDENFTYFKNTKQKGNNTVFTMSLDYKKTKKPGSGINKVNMNNSKNNPFNISYQNIGKNTGVESYIYNNYNKNAKKKLNSFTNISNGAYYPGNKQSNSRNVNKLKGYEYNSMSGMTGSKTMNQRIPMKTNIKKAYNDYKLIQRYLKQ